jgi:carboxylesterase
MCLDEIFASLMSNKMNTEISHWRDNNPNLHNPHLDGNSFFWKEGPVGVLLSHGYTATTAEIRPLAEKFHKYGYTISAPLLPGHGTQPEELNRVHWQDWVHTGRESLQKLFKTCEQVFVAGESLGGVLALYLASTEPRVAGLLLYAPAIRTLMSKLDYLKLYFGAPFMTQVGRDSLDCPEVWQGYSGLPLKGVVQLLRFQSAAQQRLSHIYQPVLVFQGCKDKTVAPEAGDIIFGGVSSEIKEHHWMENSSHVIILDAELEQVADISTQFIEKILKMDDKIPGTLVNGR